MPLIFTESPKDFHHVITPDWVQKWGQGETAAAVTPSCPSLRGNSGLFHSAELISVLWVFWWQCQGRKKQQYQYEITQMRIGIFTDARTLLHIITSTNSLRCSLSEWQSPAESSKFVLPHRSRRTSLLCSVQLTSLLQNVLFKDVLNASRNHSLFSVFLLLMISILLSTDSQWPQGKLCAKFYTIWLRTGLGG